jgi:hypothetical protein
MTTQQHGGFMGHALLETLILATGLPEQQIRSELQALMSKHGKTAENVTVTDLREMIAEYLQDVLVAAKDYHS